MRIGTKNGHVARARVSVLLWKVLIVKWSCGYEFNEILIQVYVNCTLNAMGEIAVIFTIYRCVVAICKMEVDISMVIHFFNIYAYVCANVYQFLALFMIACMIFHMAFESWKSDQQSPRFSENGKKADWPLTYLDGLTSHGGTTNMFVNQVSWSHSKNIFEQITKILNFHLFWLLWGIPENLVPLGHVLLESTSDLPVNQVPWSHSKKLRENGQKSNKK